MDTSIELRYAGVVIGKTTVAGEIDEGGLFLPVPDPLPVGTKVTLKIDDRAVEGRVISVSESIDPAKCGMKIRIGAAASWASGPVAVTTSSPSPSAAPPAASAAPPPADGAVVAPVDAASDLSTAQSDGAGDGAPGAEDSSGQAGGSGGRRKKRRR